MAHCKHWAHLLLLLRGLGVRITGRLPELVVHWGAVSPSVLLTIHKCQAKPKVAPDVICGQNNRARLESSSRYSGECVRTGCTMPARRTSSGRHPTFVTTFRRPSANLFGDWMLEFEIFEPQFRKFWFYPPIPAATLVASAHYVRPAQPPPPPCCCGCIHGPLMGGPREPIPEKYLVRIHAIFRGPLLFTVQYSWYSTFHTTRSASYSTIGLYYWSMALVF